MDINFFYFGSVMILLMGLLAVGIRRERGVLFAFIGGMVGILLMVQLNSDGAFTGLSSGSPTGIWPAMYLPMLFTILDFGLAAYEGLQ